jgi:hypothetical protein
MPKSLRIFAALFAFLLTLGSVGCTLFPEKNPPTLATTTSAEQHERILWQLVQKQQWEKIRPLLAANLVWTAPGKSLERDQVIPYLQSLGVKDAAVRDATIKPNGVDMTVIYTLVLSSNSGTALPEMKAVSVWQQVKGGGWIMIDHSQLPSTATTTTAAIR